jgi:hypothetical protein
MNLNSQREGRSNGAEAVHASGEVGTVHCVVPSNKCSTSRQHLSIDQEQRAQGEIILMALSEAVRARRRDLMREAVRKAGCFLLSERGTLADGEHEPSIITRVACRLRWINLAPSFEWL